MASALTISIPSQIIRSFTFRWSRRLRNYDKRFTRQILLRLCTFWRHFKLSERLRWKTARQRADKEVNGKERSESWMASLHERKLRAGNYAIVDKNKIETLCDSETVCIRHPRGRLDCISLSPLYHSSWRKAALSIMFLNKLNKINGHQPLCSWG